MDADDDAVAGPWRPGGVGGEAVGALVVEPFIYRLQCLNGMTVPDRKLRKYHVGRVADEEGLLSVFSDETLRADDHAFFLKVGDLGILKGV